jgi:Dolichyl-phosphate-mannose-protein mannosyltransferase
MKRFWNSICVLSGLAFGACSARRLAHFFIHYRYPIFSLAAFFLTAWMFYFPTDYKVHPSLLAYGSGILLAVVLSFYWPFARCAYIACAKLMNKIAATHSSTFAVGATLLFLLLTGILSQVLFDGLPHVADTHSQYMHAKIMAAGKFYEPMHPYSQFFDFQNVINADGKYYSGNFPGNVILLAAGYWVGAPWLINPLLGALTVLVTFFVARELAGKSAGFVAAALMLVSPYVVFMSSEYMNHVSRMFFLTAFLYAYIRLLKTQQLHYAVIAGLCLGCAFIIRVQSTVPFALPIAVHALYRAWSTPRRRIKENLLIVAGFMPFLLFLLHYNYATTGSLFVTGYDTFEPKYAQFYRKFFALDRWAAILPDIQRALLQIARLQEELFGWPAPSLIFVFLLYFFRAQPRYSNVLLLAIFGQCLALVFLYSDNGGPHGGPFPPRLLYESSSSLIILTAIALCRLPAIVRSRLHLTVPPNIVRGGIGTTMLALILLAWPFKISHLYDRYHDAYWEGDARHYHMIFDMVEKPALVFIKGYDNYRKVYFTMPPYDSNPVIFAFYKRGLDIQPLIDYYRNRSVYLVDRRWAIERIR